MSRELTQAMETAAAEPVARPIVFVEMHFSGATSHVWSGLGTLRWNGIDWLGLGNFGRISAMEETTDIKAAGLRLQLSGLDAAFLDHALVGRSEYFLRPIRIHVGFFEQGSDAVVVEPDQWWAGRMDTLAIRDEGATAEIELAAESELADFERPRERRYTHADQQQAHPGDKFFEYVESLQDTVIKWGST